MIEFFKDIIIFKWFVIVTTILFAAGSITLAVYIPNEYRAEVMLTPVNSDSQGGLGGMAGQLGGIASLAGLNVGGGPDVKIALAVNLINDWSFSDQLIKSNNLKFYFFAVIGWDNVTNEFQYDDEIYDKETEQWRVIDGVSQEPSDWQTFNDLKQRVIFRQEKNSPVINASFEYYSPELAKIWLEKLVDAINDKIQLDDMEDAKTNIDYLKSKVESTEISEVKTLFFQLLQEQMKKLMLAEVESEYVVRKVGEIKKPEAKFKPHRPLIVVLGTMFGFLLSLILISFKPLWRQFKENLAV